MPCSRFPSLGRAAGVTDERIVATEFDQWLENH
jgi:hypothetical protein